MRKLFYVIVSLDTARRKSILLGLIFQLGFFFFFSNLNAQTYNGSLTLNSQAEVDAFNYTSVSGELFIGSADFPSGDITNLNSLSKLTSVGGGLIIEGNTALPNLDDLSNLTSVESLSISNCLSLQNINGLSKIYSLTSLYLIKTGILNVDGLTNLTSVSNYIVIGSNGVLTNLNGLANLNFVGQTFKLNNNPYLFNVCGLHTLFSNNPSYTGYTSWGNGNDSLVNCNTLTANLTLTTQAQVDAFNYTSVTGNLVIHEALAGNITNLGGLFNLISLGGSLNVQNNLALSSYCGLYNLLNAGYAGTTAISGNAVNPTSAQIIAGGMCSVFSGDITLNTQAQVDAFNYTGVTGNLTIQETTLGTITNLNALSQLSFIGKNLIFYNNTALTNLNGLSHLTSLGGDIQMTGTYLANLDGLSSLNSIGGSISLFANHSLTNLDGLSHVSSLKRAISITSNPVLASISGLSNITNITILQITDNTLLTNINGLNNIQTIFSNIIIGITIRNNPVLTNLDGLANLKAVKGQVIIEVNNTLNNINGLSNLTSINGDLIIGENPLLQNIDGLANLRSFNPGNYLTGIQILGNIALKNLNGLNSIQYIGGALSIKGNTSLQNVDGFYHLNQVGDVSIQRNPAISNLNGFSNLFSASSLEITTNATLTNFCGLYNLISNSSISSITISSNAVNPTAAQITSAGACANIQPDFILTSQAEVDAFNYSYVPANLIIGEKVPGDIKNLNALSQLTGVAGILHIGPNSALTNLDGLSHLNNVGGDFFIEQDNSLTNLNGLSQLTSIGKSLNIDGNTSLTSTMGLSALSNLKELTISNNNALVNLDGLSGLNALEVANINNNNTLTNVAGLSHLASVKNLLAIRNNAALANVDGLSALNFVGAVSNFPSLQIQNNLSLTNLDGLSHLTRLEGNLSISANSALSKFCGLYNLLSTNGLIGTYTVFANATNPTKQQIIDGGDCTQANGPQPPHVSINKAATQPDPTSVVPIHFTVVFDQAVTGFDASDISFTGSAIQGTLVATVSGAGPTYDVSVSGMTSPGTVVASVIEGAAINSSSQTSLASTSTDNAVAFIVTPHDLVIVKTAASTVMAGNLLGYLIRITNNSSSVTLGVTVTDVLPQGITFNSVGLSPGIATITAPPVGQNGTVTIYFPGLVPGAQVTFPIIVTVNENLTGSITNTATVSGPPGDVNSNNNTSTAITQIVKPPTITCPVNVTISTTATGCTGSVDLGNLTYIMTGDPAPTLSLSWRPVDDPLAALESIIVVPGESVPESFPKGVTTITAKVSNAVLPDASCQFTITVRDQTPPVISCPSNVNVKADAGACTATLSNATIGTATASDNCPGTITISHSAFPLNNSFSVGTNNITWTATDAAGNTATCVQTVTVADDQLPVITNASASPGILSPPNHQMKNVEVLYTSTDNCGVVSCRLEVTSNEAINGTGDGDTSPDWEVIDDHHVKLRAERAANGDGRIYTITIICSDGHGNETRQPVTVRVTHNITAPRSGNAFVVGSTINFAGTFWDKPGNRHTAKWLLDESSVSNGIVTEPVTNQNGKVTGSYKFTTPGVYKLQMNVTDQNGITSYANTNEDLEAIVVIYDPNGGNTYGGGYYNSPAGALKSNATATGKASYGFAINYFKNSTNPKGETQFEFKVADFEFNALNFDYLVISGAKAQFRGTGKITGGQSGIGFIMTVIDGALDGTGIDKIRMKIFNKNTGQVYYDNQTGASDAANPTTAVGLNSTVVISSTPTNSLQNTITNVGSIKISPDPDVSILEVRALPNPSNRYFTLYINTNRKEKMLMQVVSINGRIIETRTIYSERMITVGDSYRPGTYIVKFIQGNQHKEIKLIKLSD